MLREDVTQVYEEDKLEEIVSKISENGRITEESLLTECENAPDKDGVDFGGAVSNFRENLQSKHLGSLYSAKAFISLVALARKASREEIVKVLGHKKNKQILHQLYDILGFAHSEETHAAAMKKLHFDEKKMEEYSERYLWALSMSSRQNEQILKDLLKKYQRSQNIPRKLEETLILSIASMAHRLQLLPETKTRKLHEDVIETVLNGLEKTKGDKRLVYLRALDNLKSYRTIPDLLKIIKEGSLKEGALAWRAIKSISAEERSEDVFNAAVKTFLQLDKKHDSSSRTIALDVILESNPSEATLEDVLAYLLSNDTAFEVKKYTLQSIEMKSSEDDCFRSKIDAVLKQNPRLYNYGVMALKGLSTALSRRVLDAPSVNGSLLSIQEINSGIVKRGVVSAVLSKENFLRESLSEGGSSKESLSKGSPSKENLSKGSPSKESPSKESPSKESLSKEIPSKENPSKENSSKGNNSREKVSQELCKLSIFSGGLSSFVSSNSDADTEEEEEATAGMEITMLGTNLRPFVFFKGQGELMGHVWSGTGSEMTTAYQAYVMLHDHFEFLRLGAGLVAEVDVKGVASFDLSGRVEISLWNRNAESLVQKS